MLSVQLRADDARLMPLVCCLCLVASLSVRLRSATDGDQRSDGQEGRPARRGGQQDLRVHLHRQWNTRAWTHHLTRAQLQPLCRTATARGSLNDRQHGAEVEGLERSSHPPTSAANLSQATGQRCFAFPHLLSHCLLLCAPSPRPFSVRHQDGREAQAGDPHHHGLQGARQSDRRGNRVDEVSCSARCRRTGKHAVLPP